jgi:hypothetical protein
MRRFARRISDATSRRLRALDRRLHIDHRGRSEWIWAAPALTFLGTVALVVVAGAVTSGTTPWLYTPIAVLVGLLMAGMSIAYMTPAEDSGDDGGGGDGGSRRRSSQPPAPLDSWDRWLREPEASRLPRERPAPRRPLRRREAARAGQHNREREREREPARR